jgi:hypothetical protein
MSLHEQPTWQRLPVPLFLRIDGKQRFADFNEGLPFVLTTNFLECITLIQPLQQIANRVATGQQHIEIVFVQPFTFENFHLLIEQTIKRQLHGILGVIIQSHIESEAALIRFEIGQDGSVLGIDLRPDHAPVL